MNIKYLTKEEIFYLIKNENGFETILTVGTEDELKRLLRKLDQKRNKKKTRTTHEKDVYYYLAKKEGYDVMHCPLMPVDFP
ncbi:MAG: hypothetical protein DRG83_03085 [Deltaproteobacteria bacterium]|nr:MAG: hypothetical protein DRG83_03085 [Deltaproteobacteria bacterium]